MQSTLSRPLPVSRGAWARMQEAIHDAFGALAATLHAAWQRWQARRLRIAEFEALRRLSPGVLRDIGASPEWQGEAQRWREQQSVARDNFLRGL